MLQTVCHPERSDCFANSEAAAQSKDPMPISNNIEPGKAFSKTNAAQTSV
jgi:hypothetical protein